MGKNARKNDINMIFDELAIFFEKLKNTKDIQIQILFCKNIQNQCLSLLKKIDKCDESNYRRNLIHLLYNTIYKNNENSLFSPKQIDLLFEMFNESKNEHVSESIYFEFDEQLYATNLTVFNEY